MIDVIIATLIVLGMLFVYLGIGILFTMLCDMIQSVDKDVEKAFIAIWPAILFVLCILIPMAYIAKLYRKIRR